MFSLFTCFIALTTALPSTRYVIHEKRVGLQRTSTQGSRVDPDAILPLRIALTQQNTDLGHDYLMNISDPFSANYGQYLTADQVHDMFAPSPEAFNQVKQWLQDSGVPADKISQSDNKVWLGANLPSSQIEKLFQTQMYSYDAGSNKTYMGCDSYSVPAHLAQHINYIRPGVVYSSMTMTKASQALKAPANKPLLPFVARDNTTRFPSNSSEDISKCDQNITPACLRALYKIPTQSGRCEPTEVDSIGLLELGDQYFSQRDFNDYVQKFAPYVPVGTSPMAYSINGGQATGDVGGTEAMLDHEIAIPLVYPQTVKTYAFAYPKGASDSSTIWDDLLAAADKSHCTQADTDAGTDCGTVDLSRVLSISYGGGELSRNEKRAVSLCQETMKLSLQGHTVVQATGDYGVAGTGPSCISPENGNQSAKSEVNGTVFATGDWIGCPYVLTVGATLFAPGSHIGDAEVTMGGTNDAPVSSRVGSTGGFANYFGRPAYQDDAVRGYFAKHDPGYPTYDYQNNQSIGANGGRYNRAGRGYPDVSANGGPFLTVANQSTFPVWGTSAAAPLFASIVTLINQERTARGKGPVGFVNQVLYAHPEAFNDITVGNNPGCYTKGFSAVPGWDPVTGLGTPNYETLLEIFLDLP